MFDVSNFRVSFRDLLALLAQADLGFLHFISAMGELLRQKKPFT